MGSLYQSSEMILIIIRNGQPTLTQNQIRISKYMYMGFVHVLVFKCYIFSLFINGNICKKSLKIPKGQSESIYRRRTDNTIAKRKRTKGQTTIYKTPHIKPKIE